jgi:hypothetical protein
MMQKVHGNPDVFIENLAVALALVRTLENRAPSVPVMVARSCEGLQLVALGHWLGQLDAKADGQPERLRRVLGILDQHRMTRVDRGRSAQIAEYLIARNSLEAPQEWLAQTLPRFLPMRADLPEVQLVSGALQTPWEARRQARLLRVLFWQRESIDPSPELFAILPWGWFRRDFQFEQKRQLFALEASRLAVALRLHQALHGKPAERLEELVRDILPAVPADPHDGKPFRYRLSRGENLFWPTDDHPGAGGGGAGGPAGPGPVEPPPPEPTRHVPAAQGILWSVGEDRQDDGGVRQGLFEQRPVSSGSDLIFLVPLPRR